MIEFQCLAYGVEQNEEGLCLLITLGQHRILLDCGLIDVFPLLLDLNRISQQNTQKMPLDGIFCSHAHADHAQGLFQLQRAYPEVPIFLSRATAKLLEFHRSLRSLSHNFHNSLQPLDWRSPIVINNELTLELLPVGHLPGAAACLLNYRAAGGDRPKTLLYTGDICLSNSRLTDGLPIQSYRSLSPDVLIMEGTFGAEKLPNRRQQENHLIQALKSTLDNGRKVAIQIAPLGMAQELLLLLKSHPLFANQPIQIWIDSNIKQACDLMLDMIEELPNRVQNFAKTQTLFLEEKLSPQIRAINSDTLNTVSDTPTIILFSDTKDIASSCSIFDGLWTFFLDEKQCHTPQAINLPHHADKKYYRLENHPDSQGILQLIHNLKPQHVAFCHGSSSVLGELCCLEELSSRYHLHLPQPGKPLEILVGRDRLVSQAPSLTEMMFEGELKDNSDGISITLPNDVAQDNRWEAIADSGIILATWQGESLMIKGISQRELISGQRNQRNLQENTCAQCTFYRQQRCLNSKSAMFRRKVSPEGFCPEYQLNPND